MNRTRSTLIACLLLTLVNVGTGHATENKTNSAAAEKYGAIERQFENGFRALLVPNSTAEQTAVTLVYFSGSLADPQGRSGLAHLLEHLLFSAPTTQGKHALVSEMARRNIAYNGNTNFDRTIYHTAFSSDQPTLNWLLEQEALRMHKLTITEADIARELPVVLREKELGDSNHQQKLAQQVLPAVTRFAPYGRPPIGNEAELRGIAIDDVRAFYRTHYRPGNALLIITGRFDVAATWKQLETHFGGIKSSKIGPPPTFQAASGGESSDSQRSFRGDGDVASVSLFYPLQHSFDAKHVAAMGLLSGLLAGSPASRLHESLVSAGQAASVSAMPLLLRNASAFEVAALPLTADSEALEQLQNTLAVQVQSLGDIPFTEQELERAKNLVRNEALHVQSQAAAFGYRLAEFASIGDWRLWFESIDATQEMSLPEIQQIAKTVFQQSTPVAQLMSNHHAAGFTAEKVSVVEHAATGASLPASAPTYPPEAASPASNDATAAALDAQMERFTIHESLAVALWPKPIPTGRVQGLWNLRMGTAESMFGKRILADVTGSLLAHGSNTLDRQQWFDRLVALDAHLSMTPADDRLSIRFDLPAKSLPEFLGILIDVLRNPAWPEQGFTEVRNRLQVAYQSQGAKPQVVAEEALTAFTNQYPIGDIRREPGIVEALAALERIELTDVKAFHADYYGTNGELILSGEFDVKATRRQLESLLGSWHSKQAYQRPPVPYAALAPGQHFIAVPEGAHGIYTAQLRRPLQADDTDAMALALVNFVLGEDVLQSRLGQRLRQQEGISYGVASKMSASAFEPRATLTINATYAPSLRQQLSKAVHEELALLVKNGLTEAELNSAKDNWRHRNDLSKLDHDKLFAKLNLLLRLRRDMQYYAELNTRVEALTLAQVNEAIARHVNPDELLEIFVDAEIGAAANASNEAVRGEPVEP
ncbi:M16 family metallopeptidase [Methylomonas rosea]|uniref:Insulinase family protein n=1 Tax=Methylomonas rosea TaxID=2952227 RepID=A0ABT1TNU2_9GAMM|nr:M16 family metallopeptidase [Methylomonas sp. WSC-7]MCQ8116421.1 insulinase family protein [Methylomonas sp. WSC-7]